MSLKAPVELRKGRNGERIFAVALFLALIVAAFVAWFVMDQNVEDAEMAFQSAHERYVLATNDAIARLATDFERLTEQCETTPLERLDLSEDEAIRSIARNLGVFGKNGEPLLRATAAAPQNPALKSARNSPYRHDMLLARSPFTGEKAVLLTAAFDAQGDTLVLAMEAEDAPFAERLLREDPERQDILLLVAQDGTVISASRGGQEIMNLVKWAEGATARADDVRPLYVAIRDRIAGFSTYDSDAGAFRLAYSPVSGADWMLCQIEFMQQEAQEI